jgi:hypothetical protein
MTNRLDFDKLLPLLEQKEFEIPINQEPTDYFPTFLKGRLDRYTRYYNEQLKSYVDGTLNYKDGRTDLVLKKIEELSAGLLEAVDEYYRGNVFGATKAFNDAMSSVKFTAMTSVSTIPAESYFYRTRPTSERNLSRKALFHNPFQNRHAVKTGRYSIPGFPALYLGSSVYVCWEEYDRLPIPSLYFSRLSNTRNLKVAQIQRLDDFLRGIEPLPNDGELKSRAFIRYLSLFPLLIACTIKTKQDGSFKPEYIIPQLLLQFISNNKQVDGIMFPSTKVDYHLIENISAYNYVFPVKEINTEGYCSQLLNTFEMTIPTSIEVEELINHSRESLLIGKQSPNIELGTIRIVQEVTTPYRATSLGYLEQILNTRALAII